MRTTRLIAGTVTAALLGVAPVGLAAPSHARDTWKTFTVAEPSETTVVFGETIDVEVDLDSSSGDAPTQGTTTLLALRAGAAAWTPVMSSSKPGGDILGVTPEVNTTYKVVYSGYTPPTSGGDEYSSSESSEFEVSVERKVTTPTKGFVLKGRVSPRYGKKPVSIRVSKSQFSGFKKFRKIQTDAKGRYSIRLPRRDGIWYWLVSVRGDSEFVRTSYTWETKIFH